MKIDPWGSELIENYTSAIKQFGLEEFDPKMFPNPSRLMRRGIIFAGRDLKVIAKCIKENKSFYTLTGIMPTSETIHFGTKAVIENIKYFQEQGAKTYVLVADLEAAATRGVTLEEARNRALNFYIPAYIALGLDPKKTIFYLQSENKDVTNLGYVFSHKITTNEFRAIYGSTDPSRMMSAVMQCGDMLYPQEEERMPGIIPVGLDQDPHIRLCRDVVTRFKEKKYFQISSIYHKFTPSVDGEFKMSKSNPEQNISLTEDLKSVKKKIMGCVTGGRDSAEEQRKLGGRPEICTKFELDKQHLIEDDNQLQELYEDCKKGRILCGECKKISCGAIEKYLCEFSKKVEMARKEVNKVKFIG